MASTIPSQTKISATERASQLFATAATITRRSHSGGVPPGGDTPPSDSGQWCSIVRMQLRPAVRSKVILSISV